MKEATMTNKTRLVAVVGPTASGKSALALALAEQMNGEIVSCDSMQVYRRMDIGTAKPSAQEQRAVRHHLIDVVEPSVTFSCADYVTLATEAILDCERRGKLPILCGGTGLYLDALLRGGEMQGSGADEALRAELYAFYEKNGAEALHRELAAIDPKSAESIHPNNVRRVIRAIEIYRTSGQTKSELDRLSVQEESVWDARVIGLRYEDRSALYSRIDRRVDQMLEMGLLEETRLLLEEGVFETNATAAQAIGYKELFGVLRGEESLREGAERLKTATRRYAKRQMTWFSAKPYVHWLSADACGSFEEIVNNARELFS